MTSLSWLIYLGGVATNLQPVFGLIGAFSLAGFVICWIITVLAPPHADEKAVSSVSKTGKKLLVVAIILLGVLVFVPSEKTFLMIAASEVSQQVINSDKMQGIINPTFELLEKEIKKKLEDSDKKS